jgi:hypothetical protein
MEQDRAESPRVQGQVRFEKGRIVPEEITLAEHGFRREALFEVIVISISRNQGIH